MQVKDLCQQLENCQGDRNDEGRTNSKVARYLLMLHNLIKDMQGGKDSKASHGGLYRLYLASGENEKASLDIFSVDARLAALKKVVGTESVSDRNMLFM